MRICICGGGNLGHALAGVIAARTNHEVSVLTRHPEQWASTLTVHLPSLPSSITGEKEQTATGRLTAVSDNAQQVVAPAHVVILCLPGFSISDVLQHIQPYLQPHAAVGSVVSSTGFWGEAMRLLSPTQPLFGLQRVPFIARTISYGHEVQIKGYKERLYLAVEHTTRGEELRQLSEQLFSTPTTLLGSHYEASLSNSNPLLHPSRLYDLWADWRPGIVYKQVPLFYEEWTERAAQLYIDMDGELQQLIGVLRVRPGAIATVLHYYQSTDAPSLARKLRSIEAFKGIYAPMRAVAGGFVPDFESRYFTEDFPFGLALIRRLAAENGVATPTMDRILKWQAEYAH